MSNTGKTIDEVTPDTSVGGAEKIPISDAGTPKSITTAQVKAYVIAGISALTDVSSTAIANDSLYIKQNGEIKPVTASAVAEAIYAFMFSKSAVTTLATTDVISIKNSDTSKTVTVGSLANYIATLINTDIDIHSKTTATLSDATETIVTQESSGVWGLLKTTMSSIADYVVSKIRDHAPTTIEADLNDEVLMYIAGSNFLRRVPIFNLGVRGGDVTGPNDAVANYIPQWRDTNGKVLKSGKSVTTSISSTSSNSEIPTALAVKNALPAVGNFVTGPESATANNIPQFSGTTGKIIKDGPAISTGVHSGSTNTELPTAKAVYDFVASRTIKYAYPLPSISSSDVADGDVYIISNSSTFAGVYVAFKNGSTDAWYQVTTTIVS